MAKEKKPTPKKHSHGSYVVYKDFGKKADGSRNRKAFYGLTPEDAAAKCKAYEENLRIGRPDGSDKITVAEWCDEWFGLYKKKVKGANAASYQAYINRIKRDMGWAKVKDIRNMHIQASLNGMEGMSPSSISKYKMVLHQVFRKAYKNHVIDDDPADEIDDPDKAEAGTHRALERWEVDHILTHWEEIKPAGIWAMIMMLSGLRRSEMVALDWDDVDMQDRTITVRRAAEMVINKTNIKNRTKTNAGMRVIPITQPLYDALNTTLPENRSGFVCRNAGNEMINKSAYSWNWGVFNRGMERILNGEPVRQQGRRKDLELKKAAAATIERDVDNTVDDEYNKDDQRPKRKLFSVRAHDLRYTFATALYDAGVDIKTAQYYLGHADIRMTMNLYTRLSEERKNKERIKLLHFLDAWTEKQGNGSGFDSGKQTENDKNTENEQ